MAHRHFPFFLFLSNDPFVALQTIRLMSVKHPVCSLSNDVFEGLQTRSLENDLFGAVNN